MEDKLYSVTQASEITGVPLSTLRRWCMTGAVPSTLVGKYYGVKLEDVLHTKKNPPKPGPKNKQNSLDKVGRSR